MFLHVHPPTPNVNMRARVPVQTDSRWVYVSVRADTFTWRVLVLCWGHCMRMRVHAGGTRTRIDGGGGMQTDGGGGTQTDGGGGTRTDGGGGTRADGGGGTQADGGGTRAGRRGTGHPGDYCAVSVNKRNKS